MLSPQQAGELLAKLREGGITTDVIHWTLDGEPFVNRDIDAICAKAIGHEFRHFIFATNGYFCSVDRLLSLPRHRAVTYQLCIDFCANPAFFERYRGTPNSWSLIRDNIAALIRDPRLGHIHVQLTDISSFKITDRVELERAFKALQDLFPWSDRLQFAQRVFHNVTGFISGILEAKAATNSHYNLCPYPWASLVIASNGDVVACCRDLDHKTVLGNLFEDDVQAIWNGDRSVALRRALLDKKPDRAVACRGCDLPYDGKKFSAGHLARTAIHRLGLLK
jgi:radical SAM protein with 4Fe4S-binding SPASM domain